MAAGGLSQSLVDIRAEVGRMLSVEITGRLLVICDKAAMRWLAARRAQQSAGPRPALVRFG